MKRNSRPQIGGGGLREDGRSSLPCARRVRDVLFARASCTYETPSKGKAGMSERVVPVGWASCSCSLVLLLSFVSATVQRVTPLAGREHGSARGISPCMSEQMPFGIGNPACCPYEDRALWTDDSRVRYGETGTSLIEYFLRAVDHSGPETERPHLL